MLQNGNFADIKYLVSKSEFASFEKFASAESLVDKRRTEEHTLQVRIHSPSETAMNAYLNCFTMTSAPLVV